jgi:hypothetical protein
MANFEAVGYIQNVQQGVVTIVVPNVDREYLIEHREISEVRVTFTDGRTITPRQRKAIFATLRDISRWCGHTVEELEAWFKVEAILKTGQDWFSLSDTDVSTAKEMLSCIIDFCVKHGVPCKESLLKRAEDIGRYLYACLIHKNCCICGAQADDINADLHHVDVIGSASRKTTEHIGRRAMALCRPHHDECRDIGQDTFDKRYNVFGIEIDKTIARLYNL